MSSRRLRGWRRVVAAPVVALVSLVDFEILGVSLLLVALVALAACGGKPSGPVDVSSNGDFSEQVVTTQDGRHVRCLFWVSGQGLQTNTSGMSCDWAGAK